MKKTDWSHLPNATHIDRVIALVKAHPDEWDAAWDAAWTAAREAAMYSARTEAWRAAREAARDAAWRAARRAVRDSAGLAAGEAAGEVVSALIAWDHAAKYLDMTPDLLRVWHALSGDHACLLLLPYAHAQQLIGQSIDNLAAA